MALSVTTKQWAYGTRMFDTARGNGINPHLAQWAAFLVSASILLDADDSFLRVRDKAWVHFQLGGK